MRKTNYTHHDSGKQIPQGFKTFWKQREYVVPLIVLIVFTALLYSRVLQNEILSWDDHWHITYNKDIQSLSIHNIKAIFTSYYLKMYHPFTTLSFALEYYFFGLHSAVYHATNVFIHLVNILLVFSLTFRLSHRYEPALIAACLFGIHPLHVESVAWITERKDVLYALFYLLSLVFYIRFIQKEGKKFYWIALTSFVASLLSKSTAITLPVVLVLVDYYFGYKRQKHTIIEKIPFFLLSIIFIFIGLRSQGENINNSILQGFTTIDRFFFVAYSLSYYIVHLFFPMNLSAFHSFPEKLNGFLPLEYYLAVLPLILLVFLGTRKGKFQREYIFGLVFFLATISPTVHIIPFGKAIVSERYAYIPFIGIYFLLGQGYCSLIDRYPNILRKGKKIVYCAAFLVVAFFGYCTYQRLGMWKNTMVLFHDAAMKAQSTKDAARLQAMAYRLEGEGRNSARMYAEAIEYFNTAIALSPQPGETYNNRGIAKVYFRDYTAALKDYSTAIELNPSLEQAYANRATIYLLLNKRQEACADLKTALGLGFNEVLPTIKEYCQE